MTPYIGKPVQFIDKKGRALAALIIAVISPEGAAEVGAVVVTLKVFFPDGSDCTVAGVEQENDQLIMGREVWRPLPASDPPVEFPVKLFVDAVTPIIEEVTKMHVEAHVDRILAADSQPEPEEKRK